MLNLGSLLGAQGHADLLRQINQNAGCGSFFGSMDDPFREGFKAFTATVIEPIRQAGLAVADTVDKLIHTDRYRPITNIDELTKGIPPCMWYGIVHHEPIRELLVDGTIDGFGINPNKLVDEDPYANICKSGDSGWLTTKDLGDKGEYSVEYIYDSTEPELTPEEAMCLSETRDYFTEFLRDPLTKFIDPTDYPNLRG